MKSIGLILAAILTVLVLVVALQNVTTQGNITFLFSNWHTNLVLPLLLIIVLAMAAGVLYAVSIRAMYDKAAQDAENDIDRF